MFSWSKQSSTPATSSVSSSAGSVISRSVHLSSYLNHPVLKPSTRKVSTDDTIYDTVFQTTDGFALIVRVYLPIDSTKAPQMSLHGVIASHSWLDIRMKVIGYKPISSDKSWQSSKLKLGDAVYAVIHHLQLHPPSVSQIIDENLARLQRTLTGTQQTTKSSPHTASATAATTSSHNNAHRSNGAANAHTQRIDKKESACKVDEDELNSLIPRVPSSFPQIDEMSLSELNDLVNNKAALETFIDSISEVNTLRELKESIETSNVDTAKSNLALEDKLESISSEVDTLKQDLKSNIERYRELEARRIAMTRPPDIQDVRRQLTSAKKAAYNESEEFADDWVESGGNDVSGFVKKFMDVRVLYHTRAAKVERLGMSM